MNAFSVSFVKTNSLPNSPRTDWYLDAMDVATSGTTPRVPTCLSSSSLHRFHLRLFF